MVSSRIGGSLRFFEARDFQLDIARDDGDFVTLLEDIDAETADTGQGHRQVHFQFALELQALLGIHDTVGNGGHFTQLQRIRAQRLEHAVEFGTGWRTGGQVQVRTVLGRQGFQQCVDIHGKVVRNTFKKRFVRLRLCHLDMTDVYSLADNKPRRNPKLHLQGRFMNGSLGDTATRLGTWDWDIDQDLFIADAHFAQLHGVDPALASQTPISVYMDSVHPEDRALVAHGIKQCLEQHTEHAEEYRVLQADGQVRWVFARGRCHSGPMVGRDASLAPHWTSPSTNAPKRPCAISTRPWKSASPSAPGRWPSPTSACRTRCSSVSGPKKPCVMHRKWRRWDNSPAASPMTSNNMLTGIIGSLDLMQRYIAAGRSDEIGRFADAAVSSAQRAAALTHRLLAFSRRQSLDRKRIDPNQLVQSLEELFSRTKGSHITLKVELGQDVWPVNTDTGQLESALLNLVINARDAMPDGGELRIVTSNSYLDGGDISTLEPVKAGDYVMIGVSDNGTGMSPLILAKAFDPFFTTKPIGQGTGLGLSMIYGFAQQSGGHVTLESERAKAPACACTCRVITRRKPRRRDRRGIPAESPLAEVDESVMVVEDDPAVRMLVLNVLDELGYTVHPAADARTALPLLESSLRIDLLVTDVGLPGMNGRQLAEVARQHRPGLKVLFMTGYAEKAASARVSWSPAWT